jgi:thiol-disulfide isomerase/thioredoxin
MEEKKRMRRTKTMWLGSMVLMGLFAPGMVRADVDPEAELKAISAHVQAEIKDAQDKKVEPDMTALRKEYADMAKTAAKGVDPAKVEPAKAMAWARLFSAAQDPQKMIAAARRFLTSNPEPQPKFNALMTILGGYAQSEDADGIIKTVKEIQPSTPMMAIQLAGTTANDIDTVTDKKGLKPALALLKQVEALVPFDQLKTPQEINAGDSILLEMSSAEAVVLDKMGKRGEALATLEAGKKRLSPKSRFAAGFTSKYNFISLPGSTAPVLKRERGYGAFTSLDAYKGKVVVLDFMAHWCPPCKAAFPDMKKMYDDLHGEGLEVVSITNYYGFFDKEKGLTPDAEFARMEGFVEKYHLTWPVVFGDPSNAENYGVSGIPHFVIIDRTGKVNSITVGYTPELHAKLRKTVESLLSRKVALK